MSFLYEEEADAAPEVGDFECDNVACEDADKGHCADFQNDRADAESGVEPDSNEWIFQDIGESVEFDITAEQAMATLRYFTSTADRTNLLTKTHHHDLDVISGLLQEKEKDLELAARIGQSLLQRNKNLLLKIEGMEEYVSNVTEQENQMRHEVSMKNELIKSILHEEEALSHDSESVKLEPDSRRSMYSFSDSGCKDESILALEEKCRELEKNNFDLLNEALMLKDLTKKAEDEEQELVVDCVKHLAVAKEQITHLTDEIALKFEDNVAQQEEITELINMVVELQRKHKQLSYENDELQYQLEEAHQDQEFLRSQLFDMQRRFEECADLLKENQDEVKSLREKVEFNERDSWSLERSQSLNLQHDSLALEIEETVKRELTAHDRSRERTSRVLEQVRNANKYLRPGSHYSASNASNLSSSASVKSDISIDSDDRSVRSFRSTAGSQDFDERRKRGFLAAEKLQIVKPMEGSVTLHKWHHLASENVVAGLNIGLVATPGNQTSNDDFEISPIDVDPTDCSSTLSNSDIVANARANSLEKDISRTLNDYAIDDNDDDDEEEDFGLTLKADRVTGKSLKSAYQTDVKSKQSTPLQINSRSGTDPFASDHSCQVKRNSLKLESPELQSIGSIVSPSHHDRSIITRNSSILDSMREARSMLKKENSSAQSKANAIDILANAMSKANVEAKTGQRILESVATRNTGDRAVPSKMRKDYEDMPKVNKVLQRLASDKEDKKVNLDAVKTPLKLLVERATEKKDVPAAETEVLPKKDSIREVITSSRPQDIPALLTIPVGMRAATGIFGNFLHQSGALSGQTSLLSTVFSSNITAVGSEASKPKQTLTRSWSSGDIKSLSKQEISSIGPLPANSESVGVGRIRSNSLSIEGAPSLSSISKSSFNNLGTLKRSNSSGSFSELAKEVEIKTVIDSPPKEAPFVSFDNYGVEDLSFAFGSSVSTATSASITTTTTTTATSSSFQSETTSTLMAGSKPTGFLRSLFLRSSGSSSMQEVKRPSSVYETDSSPKVGALGKGSSSSAESGMNRFGKALAQDDFSGFGFGFMSYFGGSKGSGP